MADRSLTPSVAVLLATYNGAAYCEDQILSLLWQRDVEVHVYARDDGSTDATPAIVAGLAARHSDRITVVDDGGRSTGSPAGNFFALLADVDPDRHSHVAFADQDDVWAPDKLAHAVRAMAGVGADGYSSDLIAYGERSNTAWVLHKSGQEADLDYLFQGASAGCTYVLSRAAAHLCAGVMAKAGPLCPGASHDWIVYAICRSNGLRWLRDPSARILYRQHASNQYGARRGWSDVIAKLRLTRSGWYRGHVLWLRHVLTNNDDESRVLSAVQRRRPADRLWLLRHAARFRRTAQSVRHLRAAILTGSI